MHDRDRLWGQWLFSTRPLEPIRADGLMGARLVHDPKGRPEWVEIQWRTSEGEFYQHLEMDYQSAMALLDWLEAIREHGEAGVEED